MQNQAKAMVERKIIEESAKSRNRDEAVSFEKIFRMRMETGNGGNLQQAKGGKLSAKA
jgi:hypothetical protein